jgi:hypothetical protein
MNTSLIRRLEWTALATGLLLAATTAAWAQSELPVAEEQWYAVTLQGQKCGYMHSELKPVGKEVLTHVVMGMEVRRGEALLKIGTEQHYRESSDGRPLAFRHVVTLGKEPVSFEGEINDGKLKLTRDQFGAKHESTYDIGTDVKFPWGTILEQRKHGLEPGTQFKVKTYDPGVREDGPFEMTVDVHGKEPFTFPNGTKRMLTKITSTMQMQVPVATVSWLDDEATPVVTDLSMGMLKFRIIAATKEEALEGGTPPELFLNTFVTVDREIDPVAKTVKLRLRLPSDDNGLSMPELPQTTMQQVERVNDHEAIVTVRRIDWDAVRKVPPSTTAPAGMEEYLRSSPILDTNDKRIRRLAKKAVKGCKTPAEKADALRKRVTEYVDDKGLTVGFATASEVVRRRSGDCSEHSVLLAAMARAVGIPARGVSGMVQVPRGPLSAADATTFGYHMWTQVYIGGRWIDIDAAMRQTDCDPTHVALVIMPLNDEGMANSAFSLLPLLGRLEIDIIAGAE